MLTVAAANLSLTAGAALPAPAYAITGFANGDNQSSTTTGAPVLSVVDTSGKVYPVGSTLLSGTYTITVKPGTLALTGSAANNYQLVYANGTVSVTGEEGQTLSIPADCERDLWGDNNYVERFFQFRVADYLYRTGTGHCRQQPADGDGSRAGRSHRESKRRFAVYGGDSAGRRRST